PVYEEILPNPRWHRLSAGFREVSALLVLAVPASAPHIDKLVGAADGAVVVGDAAPSLLPVARVIGSVREPRQSVGTPARPATPMAPRRAVAPTARRWSSTQRTAAMTGLALTLVLASAAAWLAYRPLAGWPSRRHEPNCAQLAREGRPCTADNR